MGLQTKAKRAKVGASVAHLYIVPATVLSMCKKVEVRHESKACGGCRWKVLESVEGCHIRHAISTVQ